MHWSSLLLQALNREYTSQMLSTENRQVNCPPKLSLELEKDAITQIGSRYLNVMSAKLSDGHVGVKVVYIDEHKSKLTGEMLVYDEEGNCVTRAPALQVTVTRCAAMAALAQWRLRGALSRESFLALVGIGRINYATAQFFRSLWGVYKLLLRGSINDRSKHMTLLQREGYDVCCPGSDMRPLRDCDVVSCATNATNFNDRIRYHDLECRDKWPLFIAQDSSVVLDQSFRQNCRSYTDHPEQLAAHWEDEFPGEPRPVLTALDGAAGPGPSVVYLYGIALADVVTALWMADLIQ